MGVLKSAERGTLLVLDTVGLIFTHVSVCLITAVCVPSIISSTDRNISRRVAPTFFPSGW